jgi:hypothetical protein
MGQAALDMKVLRILLILVLVGQGLVIYSLLQSVSTLQQYDRRLTNRVIRLVERVKWLEDDLYNHLEKQHDEAP